MKIAIDLDGTAFAWPRTFDMLITHLLMGRADVVFLTAAAGELPPELRPAEVARRIGEIFPFLKTVKVVCCESRDKGAFLRGNNFDLLIDDNPVEGWEGLRLHPTV